MRFAGSADNSAFVIFVSSWWNFLAVVQGRDRQSLRLVLPRHARWG